MGICTSCDIEPYNNHYNNYNSYNSYDDCHTCRDTYHDTCCNCRRYQTYNGDFSQTNSFQNNNRPPPYNPSYNPSYNPPFVPEHYGRQSSNNPNYNNPNYNNN